MCAIYLYLFLLLIVILSVNNVAFGDPIVKVSMNAEWTFESLGALTREVIPLQDGSVDDLKGALLISQYLEYVYSLPIRNSVLFSSFFASVLSNFRPPVSIDSLEQLLVAIEPALETLSSFRITAISTLNIFLPRILASHSFSSKFLEISIKRKKASIVELHHLKNLILASRECCVIPLSSTNFIFFDSFDDLLKDELVYFSRPIFRSNILIEKSVYLFGMPCDPQVQETSELIRDLKNTSLFFVSFFIPFTGFPVVIKLHGFGVEFVLKNTEYNASVFSEEERKILNAHRSEDLGADKAVSRKIGFCQVVFFDRYLVDLESMSLVKFYSWLSDHLFFCEYTRSIFPFLKTKTQVSLEYKFPSSSLITVLPAVDQWYSFIMNPTKLSHFEDFLYFCQHVEEPFGIKLGFFETSKLASFLAELDHPQKIFKLFQVILQLHVKLGLENSDAVSDDILENVFSLSKAKAEVTTVAVITEFGQPLILKNNRVMSLSNAGRAVASKTVTLDRFHYAVDVKRLWNPLELWTQIPVSSEDKYVYHICLPPGYHPPDLSSSCNFVDWPVPVGHMFINGRYLPLSVFEDPKLWADILKIEALDPPLSLFELLSSTIVDAFEQSIVSKYPEVSLFNSRKSSDNINDISVLSTPFYCNLNFSENFNNISKYQKTFAMLKDLEQIYGLVIRSNAPPTVRNYHFLGASSDHTVAILKSGVLYTFNLLNLPENWAVAPVFSENSVAPKNADLDNILFLSDDEVLEVRFNLVAILIHGQAYDSVSRTPAKGLGLSLRSSMNDDVLDDTLVMANLGYYQLKAYNPGLYFLDCQNYDPSIFFKFNSTSNCVPLVVDSFDGLVKRLPLISSTNDGPEGLFSIPSWLNIFGNSPVSDRDLINPEVDPNINIFAIASGHLYEQLLWIAILSVLKHASRPIKLWLIADFLSPAFLSSQLPAFSEIWNFQYELISYAWPPWLRRQSEKQRTIWAYKVLFLDVMFPLSLKRIIFIDADQIVRTDLGQLMDLDLEEKVYAFTPMGSSNPDTESCRFWNTGYWKKVLRGRPYHIAALFVVDLERFRKVGAGDLLRYHYQQLTGDPNNLANLEQDLTNNLQDLLPIYSLPQDWLWCETWCSMEDLKNAKTIDLCNNPLTKEHKLEKAKRLIPEWTIFNNVLQKTLHILSSFKAQNATKDWPTYYAEHYEAFKASSDAHDEL